MGKYELRKVKGVGMRKPQVSRGRGFIPKFTLVRVLISVRAVPKPKLRGVTK